MKYVSRFHIPGEQLDTRRTDSRLKPKSYTNILLNTKIRLLYDQSNPSSEVRPWQFYQLDYDLANIPRYYYLRS